MVLAGFTPKHTREQHNIVKRASRPKQGTSLWKGTAGEGGAPWCSRRQSCAAEHPP
jgi:hypothetical protein